MMDALLFNSLLKSYSDQQLSLLEKLLLNSLMDLNNERYRRGIVPELTEEEKLDCLHSYFKHFARNKAMKSYQDRTLLGLTECRDTIINWINSFGITNEDYDKLREEYNTTSSVDNSVENIAMRSGIDKTKLITILCEELEIRKQTNEKEF